MRKTFARTGAALLAGVMAASSLGAVAAAEGDPETVYAVSTSHLDTVWSWPLEETIETFIPRTLEQNFDLLEKYPDYQFNFEGAYRYQLMEEYYPEAFEKVKKYVEEGRWNVAGSGLENGDVNVPSPEALFRNFLYGNNYFEDTLGTRSRDVYLPDCFGFGYALPSIAAHSNLLGFSTQKLSWGNTFAGEKLPFDVGMWSGPDGKSIIANINYNGYTSSFNSGLRNDGDVKDRLNRSPLNYISMIFGPGGDRGGAPSEATVAALQKEFLSNTGNNINIKFASTDDMFKDMTEADKKKLPSYDGELLLKQHGAGVLTSRAISKRWNRRSELLGDAAERSNVASSYMGATHYPTEKFEEIWTRVIAHQFHDDIPGTSNSNVYQRSWNDYMVALKQFASEYQNGVAGVASLMDTQVSEGVPVVVNNPVASDRCDIVEAEVVLKSDLPHVRVYDDTGKEVAAQVLSRSGNTYKIAFIANVKSLGYRTYQVAPSATACQLETGVSVADNTLSNEKYTVTIDKNGDISNIMDKESGKELLNEPIRLGLFKENYNYWPSWELNIDDYAFKDPDRYVGGSPDIKIVENGPARVSIQITRTEGDSTYTQTVSLTAGGQIVTVDNVVDWNETATLLKAEFDLTSSNPKATYDLGLGVIQRGNNEKQQSDTSGQNKAEVPLQKWADMSAADESYGVSIINDCKYGMDKPNDSTLRLTLLHTPQSDYDHGQDAQAWADENYGPAGQTVQDMGENRFAYAVYGHEGGFGSSDVQIEAEAFNQPMNAFQTDSHAGKLGGDYSFGSVSNEKVLVRAIKKAERSDEIIVRFNEGAGVEAKNVAFTLGDGIASAREVYASEEEIGPATVKDGKLVFDIGKYGVKTFALTLKSASVKGTALKTKTLDLPYNIDVMSTNQNKTDGGFNLIGDAYAAELVPDTFVAAGIPYKTGGKRDGDKNAVLTAGQTIQIPAGYNKINILAASIRGDKDITIKVGTKNVTLQVADYAENIAAWDLVDQNQTGYVKKQTPALVTTHRHTYGQDNYAATTYMFSYEIDVTGADSITLPVDSDILVFAATAVNDEDRSLTVASELYDQREREEQGEDEGVKFVTGFEDGDLLPRENYTTNHSNVSDTTCAVVNDKAASGSRSLKISGSDNSDTGSFVYFTLYLDQPLRITEGVTLSYKFYAENTLGRYTAVDMEFNSGLPLRDRSNAVDADGRSMHPSTGHGEVGKWVTVTCDLSKCALNQTVTKIMLAYDRSADTGAFTAYIDDLSISTVEDPLQIQIDAAAALDPTLYTADSYQSVADALALLKAVRAQENPTDTELEFASALLEKAVNALVEIRNPYELIHAWEYNETSGVGIDKTDGVPTNIGGVTNGAYVIYKALDFGDIGSDTVSIHYSGWATGQDAKAEVRLGDAEGELLGVLDIPETATGNVDWSKYTLSTAKLNQVLMGEQDICVVFKGGGQHVCNVKSFQFKEVISREALQKTIDKAKAIYRLDKTEESLAVLDRAIAKAERLLEQSSPDLEDIAKAIEAIDEAMDGLVTFRNPYQTVRAWEFDDTSGVGIDKDSGGNPTNVGGVTPGAWILYKAMDFGTVGSEKISINYSGWNTGEDAVAEVHLGGARGELIGTVSIPQTSTMQGGTDWSQYRVASASLDRTLKGVEDICLVFKGSGGHVANVKEIRFDYTDPKAAVEAAIAEAVSIERDDMTADSLAHLDKAVTAAQDLLKKGEPASEAAADVIAAIQDAIKDLVSIGDLRQALEKAIEEAKNADREGKTEESVAHLDQVIAEAEALLEGELTEQNVQRTIRDLQEAVKGLEPIENPIVPGDLDKDGRVTIADVMEACKVLARKSAEIDPTGDEIARGDLDSDGDVTIADVMEICKILARSAQ